MHIDINSIIWTLQFFKWDTQHKAKTLTSPVLRSFRLSCGRYSTEPVLTGPAVAHWSPRYKIVPTFFTRWPHIFLRSNKIKVNSCSIILLRIILECVVEYVWVMWKRGSKVVDSQNRIALTPFECHAFAGTLKFKPSVIILKYWYWIWFFYTWRHFLSLTFVGALCARYLISFCLPACEHLHVQTRHQGNTTVDTAINNAESFLHCNRN